MKESTRTFYGSLVHPDQAVVFNLAEGGVGDWKLAD